MNRFLAKANPNSAFKIAQPLPGLDAISSSQPVVRCTDRIVVLEPLPQNCSRFSGPTFRGKPSAPMGERLGL